MKHSKLCLVLFCLVAFTSWAQQTPASKQTEAISITGATAHIGDGSVIENCTLVFEDGKITEEWVYYNQVPLYAQMGYEFVLNKEE